MLQANPLQCIQNAAARLVFNLPKFSHVTPLFRNIHWLLIITCIRFKTLVLACKAVSRTALTTIIKNRQTSLSQASTLLCSDTAVVEWDPSWRQDSRVAHQLPQETKEPLSIASPLTPLPQPIPTYPTRVGIAFPLLTLALHVCASWHWIIVLSIGTVCS